MSSISEIQPETILIIRASDLREWGAELVASLSTAPPLPPLQDDTPLTQKEAVDFLQVTRPTFTRWRKQGKISGHVLGGRVYFFKSELIAALKSGGVSVRVATK